MPAVHFTEFDSIVSEQHDGPEVCRHGLEGAIEQLAKKYLSLANGRDGDAHRVQGMQIAGEPRRPQSGQDVVRLTVDDLVGSQLSGRVARNAVVVDSNVGRTRGLRVPAQEQEYGVTKANLITVLKDSLFHRHVVDERPVQAVQIAQSHFAGRRVDAAVLP